MLLGEQSNYCPWVVEKILETERPKASGNSFPDLLDFLGDNNLTVPLVAMK